MYRAPYTVQRFYSDPNGTKRLALHVKEPHQSYVYQIWDADWNTVAEFDNEQEALTECRHLNQQQGPNHATDLETTQR